MLQSFMFILTISLHLQIFCSKQVRKFLKATGTVRVNRLKDSSLKDNKGMEKMDRGSLDINSTCSLCCQVGRQQGGHCFNKSFEP